MKHLILATAAVAALLTPALANATTPAKHKRHHPITHTSPPAPAPAPITSTDAATIATPAGDVRSTSLATKAPGGGPVAATTATTANMSGSHTAVTDVAQTTDHSKAPLAGAKMVHGTRTIQVRCADNSVKTVASVKGACMKSGGVVSSSVSTVASTKAGETTALHSKAAGVGATAVTSTDPNSAATTRITQTTVYPAPVKKK